MTNQPDSGGSRAREIAEEAYETCKKFYGPYAIPQIEQAILTYAHQAVLAERARIRDLVLDDVPYKYQKRLLEALK